MSTPTPGNWKYLGPDPKARFRKQLFIKGTYFAARDLYTDYVNEEEPLTPEEIAEGYGVPLEAVYEAIAYCESDPPEIRQDFEEEEARYKSGCVNDSNHMPHLRHATGTEVRRWARSGEHTGPTPGLALGHVQANLVVVPRDLAFDFLLFCQRNPKPCPLLDVTEPGCPEPRLTAPGSDLRTDLPRYRVYRHGELTDEPADLHAWWRDDLVAFLLGCSFTFENALLQAGVPLRHVEAGCNVPMYRTNQPCRPAGIFRGPMVVSMRPLTPAQAVTATRVCGRFPRAHGTPVHFGDPEAIGIRDVNQPDFGDPVEVRPGEVPVFWACGVTPQAVAMEVRPPLLITHKPGHMFVTDLRDTDLEHEG